MVWCCRKSDILHPLTIDKQGFWSSQSSSSKKRQICLLRLWVYSPLWLLICFGNWLQKKCFLSISRARKRWKRACWTTVLSVPLPWTLDKQSLEVHFTPSKKGTRFSERMDLKICCLSKGFLLMKTKELSQRCMSVPPFFWFSLLIFCGFDWRDWGRVPRNLCIHFDKTLLVFLISDMEIICSKRYFTWLWGSAALALV